MVVMRKLDISKNTKRKIEGLREQNILLSSNFEIVGS